MKHTADRRPLGRHALLNAGLGRRLLFWFVLLSILPLVGATTFGYLRSKTIIESLVYQYLDGIGDVQAFAVAEQIERQLDFLEALAGGLTRMEDPAVFLREALRASPALASVYLFSPSDREVRFFAGLMPIPPGGLSSPTAPMQLIRPDEPTLPPVLRLAVPFPPDTALRLAGIAELDGSFEVMVIPEHVAQNVHSFLLDEAGLPIVISHQHHETRFDLPLRSPLAALPPGSRAEYTNSEGTPVIGSSVPFPGQPWILVTEAPVEDALGGLQALRTASRLMEVVLGAIVVILAWLVAARIVAPVRRLAGASIAVASGDLSVRVEEEARDEFGELARSFNQMTRALEESHARVERLHQRELERAGQLATVGEMASGMAHELKNPLVGVTNGLDLVMEGVGEDAALQPLVEEMRDQLERMLGTVRDLLAFARPAPPTLNPCDLSEVCERALRLTSVQAAAEGVDLRTDFKPGLPVVSADPELLGQAVVNLVMNAVEVARPTGSVTVETLSEGGEAFIRVRDTGRGMPPEMLEKIFRPFFTTRHQGTGLGLSITRGIAERHGGRLDVLSEVGVGSTFTLVLPVSVEE